MNIGSDGNLFQEAHPDCLVASRFFVDLRLVQ